MFCMKCGEKNIDGAAFCKKCGSPMVQPVAATGSSAPAYATPAAPKPEGCVAAAWNDIRSTEGWLKKVLLLCLLGVVPVLNFAVEGYVLRWSRELSFGERTSMPREIFKKREISTGFFAWVIRIALYLIFAILSLLVTWFIVGLVGMASAATAAVFLMILSFCLGVFEFFFYTPFMNVSVIRMAVVDYLEAGFNVEKTWKSFRKSMGSAIGASIIPPIIIGVIEFFVILFGVLLVGAIIGAAAQGMYGGRDITSFMYNLQYPQAALSTIIGAGYGIMFLVSVFVILALMLNTFSMMLVTRAMGHWVARVAPEWASESDEALQADDEDPGAED